MKRRKLWIVFSIILLCVAAAHATATFTQAANTAPGGSPSTWAVALTTANSTAGDMLLLSCSGSANSNAFNAPTDVTGTHTWVQVGLVQDTPGGSQTYGMWAAYNITGGVKDSVDCNSNGAVVTPGATLLEFGGVAASSALDVENTFAAAIGSSQCGDGTNPSITPAGSGELIVFGCGGINGTITGWSAGSGFTLDANATNAVLGTEYKLSGSSGAQTAILTPTGVGSIVTEGVIAAFKVTGGGAVVRHRAMVIQH